MPTTEAQKRAAAKWRENNKEYFNKYYHENADTINSRAKFLRLQKAISKKQHLIDLYELSRAPDSPITTDEDSN